MPFAEENGDSFSTLEFTLNRLIETQARTNKRTRDEK